MFLIEIPFSEYVNILISEKISGKINLKTNIDLFFAAADITKKGAVDLLEVLILFPSLTIIS